MSYEPGDRVEVLDRDEEIWASGVVVDWNTVTLAGQPIRVLMVNADGNPFRKGLRNMYGIPEPLVASHVKPRE